MKRILLILFLFTALIQNSQTYSYTITFTPQQNFIYTRFICIGKTELIKWYNNNKKYLNSYGVVIPASLTKPKKCTISKKKVK